jgi:hypothetical protein
MSRSDLDALNQAAKEWRQRCQPALDATPETAQQDIADQPETPPALFTVGEQLNLL